MRTGVAGGQRVDDRGSGAADTNAVLDGDDQLVGRGVGEHVVVERLHHADVPHRRLDAVGREQVGGLERGLDHPTDGQQAHVGAGP